MRIFMYIIVILYSGKSVADYPQDHSITDSHQKYIMQPVADDYIGSEAITNVKLSIKDKKTTYKYNAKGLRCLSEAIYYEARGEGEKGAIAVAEVVLNRTGSKRFPNNICDVVYQKYRNICQFSFACDGSMKKRKNIKSWQWSKRLAKSVLDGETHSISDGALFFHADYVSPKWANAMYKTAHIGAHSFYRLK